MLRTTLFSAAAALLCSVVQAQLKPVTDWIDANPTNLKLDIYVPPQLAESPAILLAVSETPAESLPSFQLLSPQSM